MKNIAKKWICYAAALLFSAIGLNAHAASIDFGDIDVAQGFNLSKDNQRKIGFVRGLRIGTLDIAPDFKLASPLESAPIQAVGVLSDFRWNGGLGDALTFSMQISTRNKQAIAALLHQTLKNTDVKIAFEILEFDPLAKKWYRALSSSVPLNGQLQKEGKALKLAIGEQGAVQSPQNWSMQLAIVPAQAAQSIAIAISPSKKIEKKWGVAVGN